MNISAALLRAADDDRPHPAVSVFGAATRAMRGVYSALWMTRSRGRERKTSGTRGSRPIATTRSRLCTRSPSASVVVQPSIEPSSAWRGVTLAARAL